ncbi:hypothetical protein D3C79_883010 [compost metagenome]
MVGAGLQGHVGGGTTGFFSGGMERIDLRMGFAGTLVPTLPHHNAGLDQHGADAGVRGRGVATAAGQLEGPVHPLIIVLTKHLGSSDKTSRRGTVS